MRILAISGSTRAESSNRTIVRTALELLPSGVDASSYDGLSALPQFNPDLDQVDRKPPRLVAQLRETVGAADGVLIVSPEYAHGVPGSLKNLLDWMVGSAEFSDLPVLVVTASPWPTGGEYANAQLIETLRMMGAATVTGHCLRIGEIRAKIGADRSLTDAPTRERLRESMAALVAAIQP